MNADEIKALGILEAIQWSSPRIVATKRGDRAVRSATVTPEVRELFAKDRHGMFRAGYSLSFFRGTEQISEWREVKIDPSIAAAKQAAIEASRATDAEVEIPCPEGLDYLPFQKAGIAYASSRPATLIGDEMGLGKTVQAIGALNTMPAGRRVLVICPASLKLNWAREIRRWSVNPCEISIGPSEPNSKRWINLFEDPADSGSQSATEHKILILNYDVLHNWKKVIRSITFDLFVADEAHYCKNPKSRRAKMVFGERATKTEKAKGMADIPGITATRRLLLSGTPIANRPIELFPLISYLDPETWGSNAFAYAKRYCAAFHSRFGWDFSGASNLDELQERLRATVMVRRLKKDVLTELPAKRRAVIEFEAEGDLARFAEAEREAYESRDDEIADMRAQVELAKASEDPNEYAGAIKRLRDGIAAIFAEISTMRRELAEAKVDLCIDHIREAVEESGKLVVFAHHKTVIAKIAAAFGIEAVTLVGDTPMAERQSAVDRFQTDPTCKVFIGSLMAAGVGITLTAASHVVFCELDWVPGNISQAEDRCHRIGQKESVLVQHLVVEGSLDATMAKRLVSKQEIIDQALDAARATLGAMPEAIGRKGESGATVDTPKEKLAKEAESMTEDQRTAAFEAIRFLAARCNGARDWDGEGFSKLDARIGSDLAARSSLSPKQAALAAKIARRYARTQLPEALAARLMPANKS